MSALLHPGNKKILVTGSSGHLGEAVMRTLRSEENANLEVISTDILPSPFTSHVGSITDRSFVRECMRDVKIVYHCASLHKPHVATHSNESFIDVNIRGTLNLLEEAQAAGVEAFVYVSTTSTFGDALVPPESEPTAWITESVTPIPKNIYGVTKIAAEDLCQLFYRNHKLPCIVLRTSRFFPEEDDDPKTASSYSDENIKLNELLYRRVDIEDVVSALFLAAQKAKELGFRKFIISSNSPFHQEDLTDLRRDTAAVLSRYYPEYVAEYEKRNWKIFPSLDRIYVNEAARRELNWQPQYDFGSALIALRDGNSFHSALSEAVGSKGYHRKVEDC